MFGNDLASLALSVLYEKWGYIYGQSGAMWTKSKQEQLEKTTESKYEMGRKYGSRWIGHHVADCSGLILYLCKKLGFSVPHGSNSIWKKGYLSEKGAIESSNLPVGALVFKLRNGSDYYHVGVYVGGGKVVEAQGTKTGVVESSVSSWTHYGLLKDLSYGDDESHSGGGSGEALKEGNAVVDVPNDGTVNIRNNPSGQKQDTLREGERCRVVDISGDWAKVEYQKTGYIMAKFLRNVD